MDGWFRYARHEVAIGDSPKTPVELLPLVSESGVGWSRQQAFDLISRIPPHTFLTQRVKQSRFNKWRIRTPGPDSVIVMTITCSPQATNFRFTLHVFDRNILATLREDYMSIPPLKRTRVWYFQMTRPAGHPQTEYPYLEKIGHHISKYMMFPDKHAVRMLLGERVFTQRTLLQWENQQTDRTSIQAILRGLDGLREVYFSTASSRPRGTYYFEYEKKSVALEALVWIPSVAVPVIQQFSYYQLDASFYVFAPYVYVIPMFVVHNTGFPVALIIGRSETAGLFEHLFLGIRKMDHMLSLGGRLVQRFLELPCLSDTGTGIARFCNNHQIRQFHCHRHIIEEFGSSSIGGFICRMILLSDSLEQFKTERERGNALMLALCRTENLPAKLMPKYCTLTHQTFDQRIGLFREMDGDLETYIASWAMWKRGDVANTTNIQASHMHSLHQEQHPTPM